MEIGFWSLEIVTENV